MAVSLVWICRSPEATESLALDIGNFQRRTIYTGIFGRRAPQTCTDQGGNIQKPVQNGITKIFCCFFCLHPNFVLIMNDFSRHAQTRGATPKNLYKMGSPRYFDVFCSCTLCTPILYWLWMISVCWETHWCRSTYVSDHGFAYIIYIHLTILWGYI